MAKRTYTPEQKAARNERARQKYAALTPKQRAARNKRARQKYAALTSEQKEDHRARRRSLYSHPDKYLNNLYTKRRWNDAKKAKVREEKAACFSFQMWAAVGELNKLVQDGVFDSLLNRKNRSGQADDHC